MSNVLKDYAVAKDLKRNIEELEKMYNIVDVILYDGCRYFKCIDKAINDRIKMDENVPVDFGLKHELVNFEELYVMDMKDRIGFDIDTSIDYKDLDNADVFVSTKSIHSYKFGISSKDTDEVKLKRYSCECGELETSIAGVKCEKCGTHTDVRNCVRGWFDLGEYKVFNPQFLNQLFNNLVGKAKGRSKDELLRDLTTFRHKNEAYKNNGSLDPMNLLDLQDINNLKEWINAYVKPHKIKYFMDNIDAAMTTKIPVINKDYRPFRVMYSITGEPKVESHDLNQKYRLINDKVAGLISINSDRVQVERGENNRFKGSRFEEFKLLSNIQQRFLEIHEIVIDTMDEKEDDIRQKFGSIRLPYSGRLVLESGPFTGSDECILPYSVFGEMISGYYRDYMIKHGLTPEALNRMLNNTPNMEDCELLDKVLQDMKDDCVNYCYAFRAPSIYKRSAIGAQIVALTHDQVIKFGEITIDVCFKGDKDGDIVAIFIFPREYNLIVYFACHPSAKIWNPMTEKYNSGYELPESLYFSNYQLFKNDISDVCIMELSDKDLRKRYPDLKEAEIITKPSMKHESLESQMLYTRLGLTWL